MNNKKREKPYFFRRVVAYLIDIILVTLLATAISMVFINNTNYEKRARELQELVSKATSGEITREEYNKEYDTLNYYMTKDGVETTIVNCAVAIVYYVVLCYACKGITLGKYLMKLRIVSANENELTLGNYLIRGLFVNLILSNLVSIVFVYSMSKETFISIYPKVSGALSIFMLVTMLFMMYREDGRGLHDLMSNTKIISTKEIKEEVNEVEEAKVIEEKQIAEKTTKKNTKKKTKKEVK